MPTFTWTSPAPDVDANGLDHRCGRVGADRCESPRDAADEQRAAVGTAEPRHQRPLLVTLDLDDVRHLTAFEDAANLLLDRRTGPHAALAVDRDPVRGERPKIGPDAAVVQ